MVNVTPAIVVPTGDTWICPAVGPNAAVWSKAGPAPDQAYVFGDGVNYISPGACVIPVGTGTLGTAYATLLHHPGRRAGLRGHYRLAHLEQRHGRARHGGQHRALHRPRAAGGHLAQPRRGGQPRRGRIAAVPARRGRKGVVGAVAIPVFYLPALFYGPHTNFAIIDNWRFWIIHLWVEGFFELFATVLVAIMFHQMGVVSTKTATRLIYLDAILYLSGGIIGTGHHWYFTGQGTLNMGLASCFSALEVVPLTLLTLDAWDFIKLRKAQCSACGHDLAWGQKWSIYFLMAVGVWNFVGAGIFGFLINLPIVSYFEVGTTLTANHAHAALFGVFGMLALAVLVFCLRAMQSDATWEGTQKFIRVGFWGANVGLALMIILDLFPGGVIQLWDSVANGYWHARRLTFLMGGAYHKLEWLRMVGDVVFLFAGALPITLGALRSVWKRDLYPTA